MSLSAIVITKNEEADLPGCLESLRGAASEIVVMDGGSQDKTLDVARRYTPNVHVRPFDDFAGQKQAALDRATGDWVLSIDADERVSPELAREIREVLDAHPEEAGFEIPFAVHFMGRRLRFGGLGGERHLRLFRRNSGRFNGKVHEGIAVQGKIGRLRGTMLHVPYKSVNEYMEKMQTYTSMSARQKWERGERPSFFHRLLPAWELFTRLVLRLGILDGKPGVAWAVFSSVHTRVKYAKLRELEKAKNP